MSLPPRTHRLCVVPVLLCIGIFSFPVHRLSPIVRAYKQEKTVAIVSAASYVWAASSESIMAAFGSDLSSTTASATDMDPNAPGIQLPMTLGGVNVKVDNIPAPLFFVSPRQINFLLPTITVIPNQNSSTVLQVQITASNGTIHTGSVNYYLSVPAIFSRDGGGSGAPAGYLVRVRPDGAQSYEPLSADGTIDLGPAGERVFLILSVTGIRSLPDPNGDGNLNENFWVDFNGYAITPSYAGKQPELPGLDQINIEIPRSLLGSTKLSIKILATIHPVGPNGEILPRDAFDVASNPVEAKLATPAIVDLQWRPIGISDKQVFSFSMIDSYLFAGTDQGVFRTSDIGRNWDEISYWMRLPQPKTSAITSTRNEMLTVAPESGGLYLTTGHNTTLIPSVGFNDTLLINKRILSLASLDDVVFAGTERDGVFRKSFMPQPCCPSWQPVIAGLTQFKITALTTDGGRVFAGAANGGVFVSTDQGGSWREIDQGLPFEVEVCALAAHGSLILAGTSAGLYRSANGGGDWAQVAGPPTGAAVSALLAVGDKFFAGVMGAGVFVSNDLGISWRAVNTGLYTRDILSLFASENRLWAGTPLGAFSAPLIPEANQPPIALSFRVETFEDSTTTIQLKGSDLDADPIRYVIQALPKHGQITGDGPNLGYTPDRDFNGEDAFTYRTSDGKISSRLATVRINVAPVNDPPKIEVAGVTEVRVGEPVFLRIDRSDPDGPRRELRVDPLPPGAKLTEEFPFSFSWIPTATGVVDLVFTADDGIETVVAAVKISITDNPEKLAWSSLPATEVGTIRQLLGNGNTLFIFSDQGFFRSVDQGVSWRKVEQAPEFIGLNLVPSGGDLYLNGYGVIYRSTDDGAAWTRLIAPTNEQYFYIVAANDRELIATSSANLYLSADKGVSWKKITNGLPYPSGPFSPGGLVAAATKGEQIYVAFGLAGVFRSTDKGASWAASNTGLPAEHQINLLYSAENQIFLLNDAVLYRSSDQTGAWARINFLPRAPAGYAYQPVLLLKKGAFVYSTSKRGAYLSRDGGLNFLPISLGLSQPDIYSIVITNEKMFALTRDALFIRPL